MVSVCRVVQLRQDALFHGLVVEHLSTADVQRKSSDFAFEFASDGLESIIFGTAGDKCFDGIAVKFIGHFAQEIARLNPRQALLPSVNHTIRIVVEHLLAQLFQVAVKFQVHPVSGQRLVLSPAPNPHRSKTLPLQKFSSFSNSFFCNIAFEVCRVGHLHRVV